LTAPADQAATDQDDAVELDVRIELGRRSLAADEAARLTSGTVVALEEAADQPVYIYGGGQLIARGQVLVLDSRYCIRITERVVQTAVVVLGVLLAAAPIAALAAADTPWPNTGSGAAWPTDGGEQPAGAERTPDADQSGERGAPAEEPARAAPRVRLPFRIVGRPPSRPVLASAPEESLALAPPKNRAGGGGAGGLASSPGRMLTTVITSLSIVLGLFLLLVCVARRARARGYSTLPPDVLETLGRVPLSGRQEMHLVRVGHKLLLLSVTPTSAETLTEITDPAEIERLSQTCQLRSGGMSEAFREVLSQLRRNPH
jgi:flagellar biogenesis protein FliO